MDDTTRIAVIVQDALLAIDDACVQLADGWQRAALMAETMRNEADDTTRKALSLWPGVWTDRYGVCTQCNTFPCCCGDELRNLDRRSR